jgi:hypothetical protein
VALLAQKKCNKLRGRSQALRGFTLGTVNMNQHGLPMDRLSAPVNARSLLPKNLNPESSILSRKKMQALKSPADATTIAAS